MKIKTTSLGAAGILSASLMIPSSDAATLSVATANVVEDGFASANSSGAAGRNGGGTLNFRAFAVFSVQDILANESLVLGDLSSTIFDFSFDTANATTDLPAGSYFVDYIGFYENGDFPTTGTGGGSAGGTLGDWTGTVNPGYTNSLHSLYDIGAEIDTGVTDTLAQQSGIVASSFTLSDVTIADSASDVVVFGVRYTEDLAAGEFQVLENYTLTVVPEPSSSMLGGFAGMLLLLRRRR